MYENVISLHNLKDNIFNIFIFREAILWKMFSSDILKDMLYTFDQ